MNKVLSGKMIFSQAYTMVHIHNVMKYTLIENFENSMYISMSVGTKLKIFLL